MLPAIWRQNLRRKHDYYPPILRGRNRGATLVWQAYGHRGPRRMNMLKLHAGAMTSYYL